ncbi:MAG: ATP-binding cassette domain-containing protein [Pseudomonadota bacterium]
MTSSAAEAATRPIEVDGRTVLDLSTTTEAFRLTSGKAAVFAVIDDDGRRHPLLTLDCGDVVFGTADMGPNPVRVFVVGLEPSALVPLKLDSTLRGDAASAGDLHTDAIEHWIIELSRTVANILPPEPTTPRPLNAATDTDRLSRHEIVCGPHRSLAWIEGPISALLFGVAEISASSAFPAAEPMQIAVLEDADIAISNTAQVLERGKWRQALAAFHTSIFEALSTSLALATADEFNRTRTRSAEDDEAVSGVLNRAAITMGGPGTDKPHPVDPIHAAVRLVAEHFGFGQVDDRRPPGWQRLAPVDQFELAVDGAGLAMRPVNIEAAALKGRGLPVIVMRGEESPLVLLPHGRNAMSAFSLEAEKPARVDAKELAAAQGPAFAIYPALSAKRSLLQRVLRQARAEAIAVGLMGSLAALLALVPAFVLAYLIATAVPRGELSVVAGFSVLLVAAAFGMSAFEYVKSIAIVRAEAITELIAQPAILHRVLNLPLDFFRTRSAGEITQRTLGVSMARKLLSQSAVATLLASSFALISVVAMIFFSPILSLVALCGLGLVGFVAVPVLKWAYARQREALAIEGALTETALQIVGAVDKLRVAGAERRAFALWFGQYVDKRSALYKARAGEMVLGTIAVSAPTAVIAAVFASIALFSADVTPAAIAAFMAALANLLVAVAAFASIVTPVLTAFVVLERLGPILQAKPDRQARLQMPGVLDGYIDINSVSLRSAGGAAILSNVSLSVAPGSFTAIVGPSGAGKSTLLKVMLGLRRPSAGSVFYDGQDLANLDATALRRQFGVVLQDGALLPGSILDNLLASARVSLGDAWEALRLAGLQNDVRAMPMGIHTFVAGGSTISGGQRQRLMLARALIRKPKILFLDEATSALDETTQASVAANIQALNMTRIVVAHRLSTIRSADEILVMDGGQITERGTYEDLLQKGGRFADFARRQLL